MSNPLIERLTQCLKKANSNHEEFERKWYLACDERDALRLELKCYSEHMERKLAAVEKDAARYRWLRNSKFIYSDFSYIAHGNKKVVGIEFQWFPVSIKDAPNEEHLDAAIDAAMQESTK